MGPGCYDKILVADPMPAWKACIIVAVIITLIAGAICGFVWIGYHCGYRDGKYDGRQEVKQEAIDAGVAEYGPNPKATKFQWKPNP